MVQKRVKRSRMDMAKRSKIEISRQTVYANKCNNQHPLSVPDLNRHANLVVSNEWSIGYHAIAIQTTIKTNNLGGIFLVRFCNCTSYALWCWRRIHSNGCLCCVFVSPCLMAFFRCAFASPYAAKQYLLLCLRKKTMNTSHLAGTCTVKIAWHFDWQRWAEANSNYWNEFYKFSGMRAPKRTTDSHPSVCLSVYKLYSRPVVRTAVLLIDFSFDISLRTRNFCCCCWFVVSFIFFILFIHFVHHLFLRFLFITLSEQCWTVCWMAMDGNGCHCYNCWWCASRFYEL